MKRCIVVALLILMLTGCTSGNRMMEDTLKLRASLQERGCSFDAEITADYGDGIYTFTVACQADKEGNVRFSVISPESIAGISGKIDNEGGKLTFDDVALAFGLLADGQISPVGSPWIVVKALMGGYITSCGADGEYIRATIRDSYEEKAVTVDLWINGENIPIQADLYWENRRIISICVKSFTLG